MHSFGKTGVYFSYFHPLKSEGRRVNGRLSSGVGAGHYLKTGIWFNQGFTSFESTRPANKWSRGIGAELIICRGN